MGEGEGVAGWVGEKWKDEIGSAKWELGSKLFDDRWLAGPVTSWDN